MDLLPTIEPKSDQLNADDLLAGPITVTVNDVVKGPDKQQQPVEIKVDGHRPYRPCLSMRRVLIKLWGQHGKDWIGRSMTLYCDPSVRFGKDAVGGIRISHMSHLNGRQSMMLTVTRGRRSEYTVDPLDELPAQYPADMFDKNLDAWVAAVLSEKLSVPQIIQRAMKTGRLTELQIQTLEQKIQEETNAATH